MKFFNVSQAIRFVAFLLAKFVKSFFQLCWDCVADKILAVVICRVSLQLQLKSNLSSSFLTSADSSVQINQFFYHCGHFDG